MAARCPVAAEIGTAGRLLSDHFDRFSTDLDEFLPDLRAHCTEFLAERDVGKVRENGPWIDLARTFIRRAGPLHGPRFLLEASRPGVFAVGDRRAGKIKRVASAVDEGSIAVALVHELLQPT